MASLSEKVQTLISANLHDLLDRALKKQSPAVLDQYIRQIEKSLDQLVDTTATIGGTTKSLRRKVGELEERSNKLDRAIDVFLINGEDTKARAVQTQQVSNNNLLETYRSQLAKQEEEFNNLLDIKVKLETRLALIKQQREELLALLDLAKSKELAVKTMRGLNDIRGTGDADISRIAESIYARLDKSSTAIEMQSQSLESQISDTIHQNETDILLAERRKRLGIG